MKTSSAACAPRLWALLVAVAGTCLLLLPASALASPLDCSGATIYSLGHSGSGNTVYALQADTLGTGSVAATAVTALPNGSGANGLGITGNGSGLYAVQGSSTPGSAKVYGYSASTGTWTSYTGTGTGSSSTAYPAGAVDSLNGIFYYAVYAVGTSSSPGTATVYGFNTVTNTAISGIIAKFSLPGGNGSGSESGDFTFDQSGNLYVLNGEGSTRGLGVVKNLPSTGSVNGVTLADTTLSSVTDSSSYNGIAFDSDGYLYLESSSGAAIQIRSVDPNDGALIGAATNVSSTESLPGGVAGTADDLASCASIPTLSTGSNVPGRVGAGDQFVVSITGGTITTGNTATTAGGSTGVQAQSAGPVIASAGTTYTISETATGDSLSDYEVSYSCVNTAAGDAVVKSGSGSSFQLTYPSTSSPAVVCTFATSPKADVALSDVASSTSVSAGGTLTYTLNAANAGPGAATDVDLADALPSDVTIQSVSASQGSCAGTGPLRCELGTIDAGASATVTVTVAVSSVAGPGSVSDSASVTADQTDPDASNNFSSASITVTPAPVPTTPTAGTTGAVPTTGSGRPANQIAPTIAGTPAIGQILEASVGGWTGSSAYRFQWLRDGVAIPGATSAGYRVTSADSRQNLSVEVVGSAGTISVAAMSQTVVALSIDVRGCAPPSGRLTAGAVGGVRLGMTRVAARRRFASNQRLNRYTDNLCLAGGYGIRVGYANAAMLGHGRQLRSLRSRVVFVTSANPYYTLDGVSPGVTVASVKRRLHLGRPIHIGPNTWYVLPGSTTNHVLKTRSGVIQEVGALNRALTRTRGGQGRLLRFF